MISYVRFLLLLVIQLTTITPAASSERMLRGSDDNRELKRRNNNNNNTTTTTHHLEHHQASHLGGMEARIIGGSKTTNGRHSYTVGLMDTIGLFCGASLIANDMILTAAHCGDNKGDFDIYIGSEKLSGGRGQFRSFRKSWKHPQFSWNTMESDFMLFQLDSPTTLDVAIVTVNDKDNVPSNDERLVALGWGDTDPRPGYTGSDDLLKVGVRYIPNGECSSRTGYVGNDYLSFNGQIRGNMLCALDNGRDGCQGDSGGPLVIEGNDSNGRKDLLVGLSSWGVACAHRTLPGVYARVSSEYNWIKKIVCDNSNDQDAKGVFRCSGSGGGGGSGGGSGGGGTGGTVGGRDDNIMKPKPSQNNKPNNKPHNKPNNKPNNTAANKPNNKPNNTAAKKKKKKKKKKKNQKRITSDKKKNTTNKKNVFN